MHPHRGVARVQRYVDRTRGFAVVAQPDQQIPGIARCAGAPRTHAAQADIFGRIRRPEDNAESGCCAGTPASASRGADCGPARHTTISPPSDPVCFCNCRANSRLCARLIAVAPGFCFQNGAGDFDVIRLPAVAGVASASARTSRTRSEVGHGAQPGNRIGAGQIHQDGVRPAGSGGAHPGAGVDDQDVVAARSSEPPQLSSAMARSKSSIPSNWSRSEIGCWIFRRRVTGLGRPGVTQKRRVETTCLRRLRSSRYSATDTAAMAPKIGQKLTGAQIQKQSRYAPGLHQLAEDRIFHAASTWGSRHIGRIPHRHRADGSSEFVELFGVSRTRFRIHMDMQPGAALGLHQVTFACPRRRAVLV